MLAALKGYYDGKQIVLNEDDRKNLSYGDEVVITILNKDNMHKTDKRVEKRRNMIDSELHVTDTGRSILEIDRDIKEMRSHNRIPDLSISKK